MINNLMITSNGMRNIDNSNTSKEIYDEFRKIIKGKKVIIIGNASKVSNFKNREVVKSNFEIIGASRVDLVDLDESNISVIQDYDVCYGIGGGRF